MLILVAMLTIPDFTLSAYFLCDDSMIVCPLTPRSGADREINSIKASLFKIKYKNNNIFNNVPLSSKYHEDVDIVPIVRTGRNGRLYG